MAKEYVKWPDSEMDRLVQRFFDKVGIDRRYVRAYRVNRAHDSFTTIDVEMIFDDEPAQADVTSLDKRPGSETLPTDPNY